MPHRFFWLRMSWSFSHSFIKWSSFIFRISQFNVHVILLYKYQYLHFCSVAEKMENLISLFQLWVFPGGSAVKNHLQRRRYRFNSWVKKIPWRREWQPTPVFLPEKNPTDWGGLQATVHEVAKSQTWLKQLSMVAQQSIPPLTWI